MIAVFPRGAMLGTVDHQTELMDADQLCGHLVADGSIHRQLALLGLKLFTDADFADLYDAGRGRHSVPPSLLAKVMLLQSLEGTSDRETVDRVRCDLSGSRAFPSSTVADSVRLCGSIPMMFPSSSPAVVAAR